MQCIVPARRLATIAVVLLLSAVTGRAQPPQTADAPAVRASLFDAVWLTVRDNFYDPGLHSVDWDAARAEFRPRADRAATLAERARLINEMLGRLNASHTQLLTPDEPRYYHLLDTFYDVVPPPLRRRFPHNRISYPGIGAFFDEIDDKTFIRAVWAGFPADQAGLRMGDELVSADGQPFQSVESFRGKVGRPVRLQVRSSPDADSMREVVVTPVEIEPKDAFLKAQAQSYRIETRGDLKIGYIHIWSYAGLEYQALLVEMATGWPFQDCDALLIDLREGLGGAQTGYLSLFDRNVPLIEGIGRDGSIATWRDTQWRKPVALLVNDHTFSGKECLAHGFQKAGLGKVIGTRTAGAVLAGRAFLMPEDCALYLAVMDIRVDGQRLEGVGVTPDVEVSFDIRYAAGHDPQYEAAITTLATEAGRQR